MGTLVFGVLAFRYKEFKPIDDDSEDQQLIFNKKIPKNEENIQLSN